MINHGLDLTNTGKKPIVQNLFVNFVRLAPQIESLINLPQQKQNLGLVRVVLVHHFENISGPLEVMVLHKYLGQQKLILRISTVHLQAFLNVLERLAALPCFVVALRQSKEELLILSLSSKHLQNEQSLMVVLHLEIKIGDFLDLKLVVWVLELGGVFQVPIHSLVLRGLVLLEDEQSRLSQLDEYVRILHIHQMQVAFKLQIVLKELHVHIAVQQTNDGLLEGGVILNQFFEDFLRLWKLVLLEEVLALAQDESLILGKFDRSVNVHLELLFTVVLSVEPSQLKVVLLSSVSFLNVFEVYLRLLHVLELVSMQLG